MTDTHEAVRLAEWLENDIPPHDQKQLLQAATLMRRIPELEAEVQEQARLNGMGAERELALRAQVARLEAENAAWREHAETLTHQATCCGVAASHPDPELTKHGAYAGKWNSAQAEEVRKLRAERDQLAKQAASVRSHLTDALAFLLCEKGGNDDPHHLIWDGGAVPAPWGEVWQKYLPDAERLAEAAFKSANDWGLAFDEAEAQAMDDAIAERDQLRAIVEGRAAGCQCGDDDVCEIVKERDQLRAELGKVRVPEVDDLAQFIRQVDGKHNMVAGALAESITEWLSSSPTPPHADQKGAA